MGFRGVATEGRLEAVLFGLTASLSGSRLRLARFGLGSRCPMPGTTIRNSPEYIEEVE